MSRHLCSGTGYKKSSKDLNFSLATRNGRVYDADQVATDAGEIGQMLEHIAEHLSACEDSQIILALCCAAERGDERVLVEDHGDSMRLVLPTIVSVKMTATQAWVER